MKLGEKIRCIRELQGLSQQNVADMLNVSHTAYAKMEREETKLTQDRLSKIAKALKVQVEDIEKFDKSVVLSNHGSVHNFGYYQENHEAISPAPISDNERQSYIAIIETLKLTIDTQSKTIEGLQKNEAHFKDTISFLQSQLSNLLAKK